MRLDKFLKVARIIKRRTVANEACDAGRVEVNGMEWSAKTEHTEIIEVNTVVSIKGIQGVKLIVEKAEV